MSEEFGQDIATPGASPETTAAAEPVVEPTGHPAVDEVLSLIEDLDATPAAEQVPVYELAHEKLRAALADAGDEPPAS